jgi:two-component system, OmpR family, sensor histidine kinase SenX3
MAAGSEAHHPDRGPVRDELWDILEPLDEGVVVVDPALRPIVANAAARRLLGFRPGSLPPRLPSDEVVELASRASASGRQVEAAIEAWFPNRSTLRIRATPLTSGVVLAIDDVTDRRAAQRVRREFVSDASHELKSPVAGIQTLAEALERALDDDPASASRFARRLVVESERLGRLVSDLLDLSRLEEQVSPSAASVGLSRIVVDELEAGRGEADSKLIRVVRDVAPAPWVTGDDQQLRLMIRNLLDNAVRYSADGSRVDVALVAEGGDAVLTVSDQGIGIPLESQNRIFERFYRVDRARSRASGGTGLGLAIVKHVVDLHGGSVAVDSEIGTGSTFRVRIPSSASVDDGSRVD